MNYEVKYILNNFSNIEINNLIKMYTKLYLNNGMEEYGFIAATLLEEVIMKSNLREVKN